jgi:hypothetical protein
MATIKSLFSTSTPTLKIRFIFAETEQVYYPDERKNFFFSSKKWSNKSCLSICFRLLHVKHFITCSAAKTKTFSSASSKRFITTYHWRFDWFVIKSEGPTKEKSVSLFLASSSLHFAVSPLRQLLPSLTIVRSRLFKH